MCVFKAAPHKDRSADHQYYFRIRPHHALCMQHFTGRGYSREFTENMYKIIDAVKKDSQIKIVSSADILCRCCPNLSGNDCINCEKVNNYDEAVCRECGFETGSIITAEDFFGAAWNKIIISGRLKQICCNCQWLDICFTEPYSHLFCRGTLSPDTPCQRNIVPLESHYDFINPYKGLIKSRGYLKHTVLYGEYQKIDFLKK